MRATLVLAATLALAAPALASASVCRDASTVGGGVGGAVIGSNLASGGGRTGGAVIGGVLGALAGNQIAKANCPRDHYAVACHWTTEYRHHVAYRVRMCRDRGGGWHRS